LTTSAGLTNTGSVTIGPGASLNAGVFTQSAGSTVINGGTLNAPSAVVDGGTFGGDGTVFGSVSLSSATLSTGAAGGSLHMAGNFSQTGGAVTFNIAPNGTGGYLESELVFDPGNGAGIYNANILFDFVDGADPLAFEKSGLFSSNTFFKESDGSTLNAAALYALLSGDTFSIDSDGYNVSHFAFDAANGVTALTESPVPIPAAAWLLLSGLGTLGVFSRRLVKPRRDDVTAV
jgi:hypothetical protein